MSRRNQILDSIHDVARQTSLSEIKPILSEAISEFGFTTFGINGLPPPGEGADPRILIENTPEGLRENYIHERFYLVDHIGSHARTAYEPFRFSDAPYASAASSSHERFLQSMDTFGIGKGLVVPVGRPTNIPSCVWFAGTDPDLNEDAAQASVFMALFAASRVYALCRPLDNSIRPSTLTSREREVMQWISAGKTSWEISMIAGVSEAAINKIITSAMIKLDAVTRAQAVVNAIRLGEVEL